MVEAIGGLFIPDEIDEVVLDVGKKLIVGPLWLDTVKEIADGLPRNERMPAYISHKIRGHRLVLQCYETDYATYLASTRGEIPESASMPIGVLGVPKVAEDAIVIGVMAENHRLKGMYQGLPAGCVNLDELDNDEPSPLSSFYNELFEETNLRKEDIKNPVFLGLVSDTTNREIAIVYGFDTGMLFDRFSSAVSEAQSQEYQYLIALRNMRSDLFRFARGAGKTTSSKNATTHCRGAVALYAFREFPDSSLIGFLADSNNRIFGYLK